MAQFVLQFHFAIPAGTPIATPAVNAVPVDNYQIERLELEVPKGPAGTMGFAVWNSGTAWKPDSPNEWLVWDGYTEGWWLNDQPSHGGWQIAGYNTGVYTHTVYTRWLCNQVPTPDIDAIVPTFTFVTRDVQGGGIVTL